ncbi:MAG TPA: TIGR04190 family B12-binding domain/radical SAM domain protein [Acidobacteriaceae bacterium]|jgi:B12-binding domain/radical SAM domain protein|nr:TIGR04190 family B12-binding domain/radical SAM domain protein [Acidobacteriaceae bacterium]
MAEKRPLDLLLLHAPSVYDFREKAILYGPLSDLIPSSPVFEMYPLGFLTMASYLQDRGMRVRIVNLALRMMDSRRFDVPKFLKKFHPRAVGIDLHWLPHAHGALEVAKIVKEIHPDVPVILGGLSSTYFHEELIRYPQVDYVLRGDSTEPPLYDLLRGLGEHGLGDPEKLRAVPNLTWKWNGLPQMNALEFTPPSLDYADLRPDRMIEMVMEHGDLRSVMPFNHWWRNPITAVFTAKGCAHQCATCGSSQSTCVHLTKRHRPAFRSPASLTANIQAIAKITKAPVFLVGDLLQGGRAHGEELLDCLKRARIKNEIVFEFFAPPPKDFLQRIDDSVQNWSIEVSPDSHDAGVRRSLDRKPFYENKTMEASLQAALALRCHRIDVFYLIGIPHQTHQSVLDTVTYCEHLFRITDKRLSCFISPVGPFVDPGSRAFEDPELFGYRFFARTLEEHRQLLVQPSWESILNYETESMTRAQLVDATYDAAERLNALKLQFGRVPKRRGMRVAQRIREARELRRRIAEHDGCLEADLKGEVARFSQSTVCDKRELFWPRRLINFRIGEILRIGYRHYFPGPSRIPADLESAR